MKDMYSTAKKAMNRVSNIGKNIGGAIGKKMKMGTKASRAKVANLKKQKAALK